jgi:hypothetical protein
MLRQQNSEHWLSRQQHTVSEQAVALHAMCLLHSIQFVTFGYFHVHPHRLKIDQILNGIALGFMGIQVRLW